MKGAFFFIFLLTVLFCCKQKERIPKDVLPAAKMQAVLWDMINAGQYLSVFVLSKDTVDKTGTSAKIYGEVFQVHHITEGEFDRSYSYYKDHPELMKPILDSLSKRQSYEAEKFQRKDSAHKKIMLDKNIR